MEGLSGRLVSLASGGGVAAHSSNLCNHLAAVLVPPLVALQDVGVNLLVARLASQPEGRPGLHHRPARQGRAQRRRQGRCAAWYA
eukprot:6214364-Pleurochrysis_carterae.AAC.12